MPAQHKYKRLKKSWMLDGNTRTLELEGAERQRAKRVIAEGIEDSKDEDESKEDELFEAEMKMAIECYQRQKVDTTGTYKCTCHEPKDEE